MYFSGTSMKHGYCLHADEKYIDSIPVDGYIIMKMQQGFAMTTKDIAIQTIQKLPDDATWEDIQERINFIAGIRRGMRELDEGKGIPHEQIKDEFKEWLST